MFFQQNQHINSYYAATAPDFCYPNMEGDTDCEVLVIGAGFAGLHTALRLAEAGKKVTVIESSRVGWAASGRNGGMAILGWSCDMGPLEAELGREGAQRLWDLVRLAAAEIKAIPARYGFDCDYQAGHLWTSVLARRVSLLQHWQEEAAQKWGYDKLQFISKTELPDWVGSTRYAAGLFDPEGGHVHPLKLAQGLAQAFTKAGGQLFEGTRALSYDDKANAGVKVHTERGTVRADTVVLACNAYIDRLDPTLSRKILSAGTYMVATEVLAPDLAQSLIPSRACVTDNQFILDYFRIAQDGRLLFGGGSSYLGGIPKNIPAAMRPHIERVFPQLKGVKIDYSWGGHIDLSLKRTPNVGQRSNIYWLTGFSGHGVLPTWAAARALSSALLGERSDLDLFMRLRHPPFPGPEWLAPSLEAAGKLYYRLRDVF